MNKTVYTIIALAAAVAAGPTAFGLSDESVAEYWPVALQRAGKIVDSMGIDDAAAGKALQETIAGQYRDLYILHALRDEALQAVDGNHGFARFTEVARQGIEQAARESIDQLHRAYVARLESLVDAAGVEAVKDGMTYSVAPNTLRVYRDMFPDLPEEHMSKIKAWLWEAREHAMDAGSSDDKHKWFGKYKGRINNYLSGLGHDLKQAEREMFERKKREQQGNG